LPIRPLEISSLPGSSPKASRRVQLNIKPLKPEETPKKNKNHSKYDFRQISKILNLKALSLLQPLKSASPSSISIHYLSIRNLCRGKQPSHNNNTSDSNNEESNNEETSKSLKNESESSECFNNKSDNDSDDNSDIII